MLMIQAWLWQSAFHIYLPFSNYQHISAAKSGQCPGTNALQTQVQVTYGWIVYLATEGFISTGFQINYDGKYCPKLFQAWDCI